MLASREVVDVVHVVVEADDLERLELERHLVDDAGKPIAGPDERQQLGILVADASSSAPDGLTHLTPVT